MKNRSINSAQLFGVMLAKKANQKTNKGLNVMITASGLVRLSPYILSKYIVSGVHSGVFTGLSIGIATMVFGFLPITSSAFAQDVVPQQQSQLLGQQLGQQQAQIASAPASLPAAPASASAPAVTSQSPASVTTLGATLAQQQAQIQQLQQQQQIQQQQQYAMPPQGQQYQQAYQQQQGYQQPPQQQMPSQQMPSQQMPSQVTDQNVSALAQMLQQNGIAQQTIPANMQAPGLDLPVDETLPAAEDLNSPETQEKLRKEAFDAAVTGLMPMQPPEIRRVLEVYDETQQAVETPVYPYPKPEMSFTTISLDPGKPPVTIRTAVGHVTTLNIVDASGQPWPIQDISWAGNFEVLQPESGSHILRITPMAEFAFGNVSMRLLDLNTPVILSMKTVRDAVQVRVDLQIPELGPKGVAQIIEQPILTTAGSGALSSILEGVMPPDAQKLQVSGVDGRTSAYTYNGQTYVRTPYTLLSPAWSSSVKSADGTNVYALNFAPVLLLSDKGQMVRAHLKQEVKDQ